MRRRASVSLMILLLALFVVATIVVASNAAPGEPRDAQGPLPLTALVTVTPSTPGTPEIYQLVTVTPDSTSALENLVTVTPFGYVENPEMTTTALYGIALTPIPNNAPGCVPAIPLEIGSTVTVRGGISIRYSPSVSAPLLTTLLADKDFVIVSGPSCVDGYLWWGISSAEFSGWVAERNVNMLFIRGYTNPSRNVCGTPLDLTVGQSYPLEFNVRVRLQPDSESLVLTVGQAGTSVTILSAAECHDGYNWRRVRVDVAGATYEGYIAEGVSDPSLTFLELPEAPLCFPALSLATGDWVRVYYTSGPPKNLRAAPSYTSEVLYTLVSGVPLEITGPALCLDGMNWWPVRVLGSIPAGGWIAEGGRPIPSIRPFDEPPLPLPGR